MNANLFSKRTPGLIDQLESDLPEKLGAPARRALIGAGVWRLEQLAAFSEAEVKALHGIGANAMKLLQETLEAQGLGFRS